MNHRVEEIAVVVPSRNEARLLPRALMALDASAHRLTLKFPHLKISLTVVLDSSTDTSAQILADRPHVRMRRVSAGRVGAARNAGIAAAMSASPVEPTRLWIANTDADSAVPPEWLECHHALAVAGADVVVGTVEPFHAELSAARLAQWRACHELREGHPHIQGANLGFRADIFTALGGFPDLGVHEDRKFVANARARGFLVHATDSCRVPTSGRLQGRVEGGFAGFLANLEVARGPADAVGTSPPCAPRITTNLSSCSAVSTCQKRQDSTVSLALEVRDSALFEKADHTGVYIRFLRDCRGVVEPIRGIPDGRRDCFGRTGAYPLRPGQGDRMPQFPPPGGECVAQGWTGAGSVRDGSKVVLQQSAVYAHIPSTG